jgi:hypothetical protein
MAHLITPADVRAPLSPPEAVTAHDPWSIRTEKLPLVDGTQFRAPAWWARRMT